MKQSRSTLSLLWYILFLSRKYNLDVTELCKNLVEATSYKQHIYGGLEIKCRGESENLLIFQITDNSGEYIAQLHVPKRLLEDEALVKILNSQVLPRFQRALEFNPYTQVKLRNIFR
jgi:hypothetical protein